METTTANTVEATAPVTATEETCTNPAIAQVGHIVSSTLRNLFDTHNALSGDGATKATIRNGNGGQYLIVKLHGKEGQVTSCRIYVTDQNLVNENEVKVPEDTNDLAVLLGQMQMIYKMAQTWGDFSYDEINDNFGMNKVEARNIVNALLEQGCLTSQTRGRKERFFPTDVEPKMSGETKTAKKTSKRTYVIIDTPENRQSILAALEEGPMTASQVGRVLGDYTLVQIRPVLGRMVEGGILETFKSPVNKTRTYALASFKAKEPVQEDLVAAIESGDEAAEASPEVTTEEIVEAVAPSTEDDGLETVDMEETAQMVLGFLRSKGAKGQTLAQVSEFLGEEFEEDQVRSLLDTLVDDKDVTVKERKRKSGNVNVYIA